jgi:hypothetical protein
MVHRIAAAVLAALLLVSSTGCSTADLDVDGDGIVSESDLITFVINGLGAGQGTGQGTGSQGAAGPGTGAIPTIPTK